MCNRRFDERLYGLMVSDALASQISSSKEGMQTATQSIYDEISEKDCVANFNFNK